jgi:hypothetical protein
MPSGVDLSEEKRKRVIKLRISDPSLTVDQIGKLTKLHRNTVGRILSQWYREEEVHAMAADFLPEVVDGISNGMKNLDPLMRFRYHQLVLRMIGILQPKGQANNPDDSIIVPTRGVRSVAVHMVDNEHGERATSASEQLRDFVSRSRL